MSRLNYRREDILAEHPYAHPHVEAGYTLHGGFDADDCYISPRTLHRWPAIRAWSEALEARGGELIDSSQQLMVRGNFPNMEQERQLLSLGIGQRLWNALTVTGIIEARGKRLADAIAPDFQAIVVEDISDTATGHLNKGLLRAHGLDEGGDGAKGGHDAMWFAVRDMLFGENAFPLPNVPESLSRPEIGRTMPQIAKDYEEWILLLMNVLMIEVRAENFFNFCTRVMRDPRNFTNRRDAALHAADLVDRIRADEAPHVGYLTAVISELRSFSFQTVDGDKVRGKTFIDPVWNGMVHWHTVMNADFDRQQTRQTVERLLTEHGYGADEMARFDMLEQKDTA